MHANFCLVESTESESMVLCFFCLTSLFLFLILAMLVQDINEVKVSSIKRFVFAYSISISFD